ncbi:hypothetical protein ACMD2_26042 [Ananas comosus]|uniref:FAR1 domain-containing protein n=1 Tax=Ananas comosus TaxID=4615 RepID=A0A199W8H9_ANACO|nr:hypothetical protein ACMD2_26042 [Ananas comosus]
MWRKRSHRKWEGMRQIRALGPAVYEADLRKVQPRWVKRKEKGSMCNLDVRDEVNEEIEEIVANDQISNMSKYSDDELRYKKTNPLQDKKQDDVITSITYCCSKAGHSKPTSQDKSEHQKSQGSHTPKKDCSNRRTNCKAHVVLKIDDRGKWVIAVVANEHNHELIASPFKTRFFRSHRNITKEQKDLIHMLNEQNIFASQIIKRRRKT